MEPKVIFEDSEILVLDKPWGMTVNRADTTRDEMTVQDWVEEKLKAQSSKFKVNEEENNEVVDEYDSEKAFFSRAGIVHRIDKETSGILLVAKTLFAFKNLQLQFKERKVKKAYTALVHGKIDLEEGEINVPVGRLPWNRERFGVIAGGREARTLYKVLSIKYFVSGKKKEPLTLLEAYPETGRTHQIRVHLKYINHPIFADEFYAGRKTARNDRKNIPRLFLHASRISFFHPRTGDMVSFESILPHELKDFLEKLLVV